MSSASSGLLRVPQLALFALLGSAPTAAAQVSGDADLKAISSYTLTVPKYKQYLDALLNMANVAAKEPAISKGLDGLGNKSLAEQVKALDGVPQLRGGITAAGLTVGDFVLIQGAALQAGMAHAFIKSGALTPDSAVKQAGVSRANLEFYQKNEAEIERLTKEYQAKAPQLSEDE
ncbi:MAG TPA: hypothetical protein VH680_19405 [Gemmatimonadales bacterium]|jgi:hypothetical protein